MRRAFVCVCLVLLGLAIVLPTPPPAHAKTTSERRGFVRVYGTQFALLDKPFRFVGANASIMALRSLSAREP